MSWHEDPIDAPQADVAEDAYEAEPVAAVAAPVEAVPEDAAVPASVVRPRSSAPDEGPVPSAAGPEPVGVPEPVAAETAAVAASARESAGRGGAVAAALPLLSALLDTVDTPEDLVLGLRELTDEAYRQRVAELLLEQM